MDTTRTLWLIILFTAWALAWGGSFAAFALTPPEGDGFTRGLNRVAAFLGWQGVAAVIAVGVWGLGRDWPSGSPVRRLSRGPLWLAGLLALAIAGFIVWARFQG